jgi:hypothetical protein
MAMALGGGREAVAGLMGHRISPRGCIGRADSASRSCQVVRTCWTDENDIALTCIKFTNTAISYQDNNPDRATHDLRHFAPLADTLTSTGVELLPHWK